MPTFNKKEEKMSLVSMVIRFFLYVTLGAKSLVYLYNTVADEPRSLEANRTHCFIQLIINLLLILALAGIF